MGLLGQHGPRQPQPESCRFCCFSGVGSSPHGRQLPAPTAACSLCIVRAKGTAGRAEREEGNGNYKNQQRKKQHNKKKKAITPGTAAGVQRTCTCCLQTRAGLPAVNIEILPERAAERPGGQPAAPAEPRSPGAAGPRSEPPLLIHSSGTNPARGGREPQTQRGWEERGEKRKKGKKRPWGARTPRGDVPASLPSAGLPPRSQAARSLEAKYTKINNNKI